MDRIDDYRNVVFARKCNRGRIHDRKPAFDDFGVADAIEADRIRVLLGVGRIDPVDLRALEQRIGTDLGGAKGRGG